MSKDERVNFFSGTAEKCGIEINGNAWYNLLVNSIKQEKATQLTGEQKMTISH